MNPSRNNIKQPNSNRKSPHETNKTPSIVFRRIYIFDIGYECKNRKHKCSYSHCTKDIISYWMQTFKTLIRFFREKFPFAFWRFILKFRFWLFKIGEIIFAVFFPKCHNFFVERINISLS